MPIYTDRNGNQWNLPDWAGNSYKAIVINRAYRNHEFDVVQVHNQPMVFFQCFWCKKAVPTSGVEGDHVVQQSASGHPDGIFQEAEAFMNPDNTSWNLVLSCSECNGGSRNKKKIMTRDNFRKDRDDKGPVAVDNSAQLREAAMASLIKARIARGLPVSEDAMKRYG